MINDIHSHTEQLDLTDMLLNILFSLGYLHKFMNCSVILTEFGYYKSVAIPNVIYHRIKLTVA